MMTNNKTNEEKLGAVAQMLSDVITRQEHSGLTIGDKRHIISKVYKMFEAELAGKEVL